MKRDLKLFIEDILENIDLIENSAKKLSKSKFESNKDVIDATVRRLEIIGEAVKNIPDSFREKYQEVPWSKIAGFRDVLTHGYFKVDLDLVWKIMQEDLIDLKEKISKIKRDLEEDKNKTKKKDSKKNKKEDYPSK